jgi:hypothetical protein
MLADRSAPRREMIRVQDGRAQHLAAISCAKCLDEVSRQQGRAKDIAADTHAHGGHVERLDAGAVVWPDLVGATLAESESENLESNFVEDEPNGSAERRARRVDSHVGEHPTKHSLSLVDSPRVEKVVGGGALERDPLDGRRALGSRQVDASSLFAPSCPSEHFTQARTKAAQLGRRGGERVDRQAEEAHGLVERKLLGGAFGSALRKGRGAFGLAGAEQVYGDRLGV